MSEEGFQVKGSEQVLPAFKCEKTERVLLNFSLRAATYRSSATLEHTL